MFTLLIHAVTSGQLGNLPHMSSSWLAVSRGAGVSDHVSHPPVGHGACSYASSKVQEGEGRLQSWDWPSFASAMLCWPKQAMGWGRSKGLRNRFHLLMGRAVKSLCKEA